MQVSHVKNSLLLQEPFSETEALYLQDLFLTAGFHQVYVENFSRGRSAMYHLLDSLQCHQKIGCLSLDDTIISSGVTDVLAMMVAEDYLLSTDRLTLFLLERFDFDFVWIEESSTLMQSIWYKQFKNDLINFKIDRTIPIIRMQENREVVNN